MFASADRLVLIVHDRSGTGCSIVAEIASKSGNRRDDNNHTELATFLACTHTGIDDRPTDLVEDRSLLVTGGSDWRELACIYLGVKYRLTEELVFNVDKVLRITDRLTVCVLDTVLIQDTAAPVVTAAHDLGAHGTDVTTALGGKRGQRMLDVITARVLGALHGNDIFVFVRATLHQKPVDVVAALVLVALDEVPAQDEVLRNVEHAVTLQTHRNVVPRHTTIVCLADFVALPVLHTLEVHDSVVIEILAGEDVVSQSSWVNICQWVLVCIPSSEAKINTANECYVVVDHDELLVMRPVKCHVSSIFEDVVVGMAHHSDVAIARCSLGAQVTQRMFCVRRITCQGLVDLSMGSVCNFSHLGS